MPYKHRSHKTVWERHKKWSEKGVWKNIMDSLVSHGYHKGLINVDGLSIDISTGSAKKGGQEIGFDGHKRFKGSKRYTQIHTHSFCLTSSSLPVTIDLGPGNEHESRRLIILLKRISESEALV